MPAIKGDMYINTHCNYSQPTLIKLYNENIGGHLTPLQPDTAETPLLRPPVNEHIAARTVEPLMVDCSFRSVCVASTW